MVYVGWDGTTGDKVAVERKVEFNADGDLVLVSGVFRLVLHEGDGAPRIEIVTPDVATSISVDTRQLGELALAIIHRLEVIAEEAAVEGG